MSSRQASRGVSGTQCGFIQPFVLGDPQPVEPEQTPAGNLRLPPSPQPRLQQPGARSQWPSAESSPTAQITCRNFLIWGIHNVVLNVPVACLSPKVLPAPTPAHNIRILSKSRPDSGQKQKSVSSPNGLMGTVDLYLASWDHSY